MKNTTKRAFALLLTFAMMLTFMPFASYALGAVPRVALLLEMDTSATPNSDVDVNEEIIVSVRFRSILAPNGEPVTVTVTNGAQILINDESDVLFEANGVARPIRNIIASNNSVSFTTGAPATTPLFNDLTFSIAAPSSPGDFSVSVLIGNPGTTPNVNVNFAERTFTAVSSFFVQTSHDVIIGRMPFDVFGGTDSGANNMVALEFRHIGSDFKEALGNVAVTDIDGTFLFNALVFPANAPAGMYEIGVVLIDVEGNEIDEALTVVEFVIPEPFITVNTTYDVVYTNAPFFIFGEFEHEDAATIAMAVTNDLTGYIAFEDLIQNVQGSTYSFGSLVFTGSHAEGLYTVFVVLLDSEGIPVAFEQMVFEHSAPPPPPPPAQVTSVTNLVFTPSDTGVTYPLPTGPSTRLRVRRPDNPIVVSGIARDASGNPVEGATLRLTFVNEGWTNLSDPNRNSTETVVTGVGGTFSRAITLRQSAEQFSTWVTISMHFYDTGVFVVRDITSDPTQTGSPVEVGTPVTVPVSHRNIFIQSRSVR
ncbi:MAG: hypothetical protein FWB92_11725 [Oscillospiraceae bacterium]|nr:hypothetical protein [Oscillospiraceae bacterium]